jgi:hypothetical protein
MDAVTCQVLLYDAARSRDMNAGAAAGCLPYEAFDRSSTGRIKNGYAGKVDDVGLVATLAAAPRKKAPEIR